MPGLHIKKGDQVIVLSGKDRNKQGRVVRTMPKNGKVMIEGVNQVKRHEPLRQAKRRNLNHSPRGRSNDAGSCRPSQKRTTSTSRRASSTR